MSAPTPPSLSFFGAPRTAAARLLGFALSVQHYILRAPSQLYSLLHLLFFAVYDLLPSCTSRSPAFPLGLERDHEGRLPSALEHARGVWELEEPSAR